jgi:hypothetical protein
MRLHGISRLWLIYKHYLFMDFLYLQRGLESGPRREILYIYNAFAVLCFCISIHQWRSPPPPPTRYKQ